MSLTKITRRVGAIYDSKGEFIEYVAIDKTADTFKYGKRTYNVLADEGTYTVVARWYWDLHIYHYTLNNPDALRLNPTVKPIMHPELYQIQLDNHVARDLNSMSMPRFELNGKTLLIILGGIALLTFIVLIMMGKINLTGA